ncbi:hypothetical protein FO519_004061 [Halicephalobus sp. NKZ332]|nr:hypothetical protein FO519_004061 [Halicephalobus sp. NKZ332]
MLSTEKDRNYCGNEAIIPNPYYEENGSLGSQQILSEVQLLANLIEKASVAYAEGDLQKALDFYEQAVLVDPANNVLYANRSAIYLKLGFAKEALDEACHSIQLNPDWPKAYFRKGEALKEAKQFEKAVVAYSKALQLCSENERFLIALISCARKSKISVISVIGQGFLSFGDFETCISILKIALNIDSPSLKLKESTLGALAKAYYEAENPSKALDYLDLQLELLIQLNDLGAQIEVYENIIKIATKENNFELVLLHRDNQIMLAEKLGLPSILFKADKIELLEKMGNIEEAVEFCKDLLIEDRENFEINMKLGNMLMKQNYLEEAMSIFEKIKMNADSDQFRLLALIRIAQCELLLGQEQNSVTILEENLENKEILGNVLGMLCKSAENSGDIFAVFRIAKKQLKIGIESKNERIWMEAHNSLSFFYEALGQSNINKNLLPGYISTLRRLGKMEMESGDPEAAIRIAKRRMSLIPEEEIEMKALVHSDLISIYRRTNQMRKREKHLEEIKKLTESKPCSWIYEKEIADFYFDKGQWAEAKFAWENALISVQEINNENESEICKKLGLVHLKLELYEEAVFYFNQFLMIVQQKKNTMLMSEAHALLSSTFIEMDFLDEALDHARCRLTLSSILNQKKEKINSFIILGKIFEKKEKPEICIKILQRAKNLAEKNNFKEELAVCYGFLGEANLKLGLRKKALSNFCKQLSFFSFIKDIELKCRSINYLIEDKSENGDVAWATKLIRLQQTIAKEGRPNLQIEVQRDSAKILYKLGLTEEAVSSLEKALMLSIQHEHNDTVSILLQLCDYYSMTLQYHKGIKALENFAELQDGLCGPAIYYNLGLLYLKEGRVEKCLGALENCKKFDAVDKRFMYVLACAYCRKNDFEQALNWLDKVLELSSEDPSLQEKLLWERFSLSIRCGKQVKINEELYSLMDISTGPIHIYLDELNLYSYIDPNLASLLPEIAKIHLFLNSMDYQLALDLIQSSQDQTSLVLEKLVTEYFLGIPGTLFIDVFDIEGDDFLSLFSFDEKSKEELIVFIHALSSANSLIDAMFIIEKYRWKKTMKKFVTSGISYCVAEPAVEDVEVKVQHMDSFVYSFEVFGYSLIWIKSSKNDLIQMFYKVEKELNKKIPLFYDVIMEKAIDVSELPEVTEEINLDFAIGDIIKKRNQLSLLNYCPPRIKPMTETSVIFIDEKSEESSSISLDSENVSTTELVGRISEASVVYINMDKFNSENVYLSSFFRSEFGLRVAILQKKCLDKKLQKFVKIYNRLDIDELLSSMTGEYAYFSIAGSPSIIEVVGLGRATRSILAGHSRSEDKQEFPERYQLTISRRIEQVLAANDITEFDHMEYLEADRYPFDRVREFVRGKNEIEHLLFADFLIQPSKQIRELSNDEICQLMKSFEVRKKWRKSRRQIIDRNCYSDGEQLAAYSDKDLTDTESVSGARVIGIETCDDIDYFS